MTDHSITSHVVMDIRIHAVTMKEAVAWAKERIEAGKPSMIATANAEMIMIAQKDRELGKILNHADLVVPDGAGVLWAGEQLGTPFPERVTGADLTPPCTGPSISSEEIRESLRRRPKNSWKTTAVLPSWDAMTATSMQKKKRKS